MPQLLHQGNSNFGAEGTSQQICNYAIQRYASQHNIKIQYGKELTNKTFSSFSVARCGGFAIRRCLI